MFLVTISTTHILNTFNAGLSIYPLCKNIRKTRLHVLNYFEIYAEIVLKWILFNHPVILLRFGEYIVYASHCEKVFILRKKFS